MKSTRQGPTGNWTHVLALHQFWSKYISGYRLTVEGSIAWYTVDSLLILFETTGRNGTKRVVRVSGESTTPSEWSIFCVRQEVLRLRRKKKRVWVVTKGHRWHGSSLHSSAVGLVCLMAFLCRCWTMVASALRRKRSRKPSDKCIGTSYHVKGILMQIIAPCIPSASYRVRWSGGAERVQKFHRTIHF